MFRKFTKFFGFSENYNCKKVAKSLNVSEKDIEALMLMGYSKKQCKALMKYWQEKNKG